MVIGTITTLTNIYAPGKVSASVKKVWNDGENQDGIRPETLRVNLLKNGQATDQFVILSEENRWSATLDNLDEYTDGTLNEYTWSGGAAGMAIWLQFQILMKWVAKTDQYTHRPPSRHPSKDLG